MQCNSGIPNSGELNLGLLILGYNYGQKNLHYVPVVLLLLFFEILVVCNYQDYMQGIREDMTKIC